jgi:hypothetical protein
MHPRQINSENDRRAATAVEPTTKSSLFEVSCCFFHYEEWLLHVHAEFPSFKFMEVADAGIPIESKIMKSTPR